MSRQKQQNDNLIKIVEALNQGSIVSGNNIAKNLGISRSAVWKAIKKLVSYGLPISSHKDGYKLSGNIILLNHKEILSNLKDRIKQKLNLEIFETIESTNQYYLDHTTIEHDKFNVCLTEFQNSGKGRLGRTWQSPFGKNICLSICMFISRDLSQLGGLSLATSLAIAKTLQKLDPSGKIKVKWPNDIICDKKKLSGNLIQVISEPNSTCKIIVGMGINVNTDIEPEFSRKIGQPWISLKEILGVSSNRNILAAELITTVLQNLMVFEKENFAYFLNEWNKHDYFLNKEVALIQGKETIKGIARGVDKTGQLLLELPNGSIKSFSCGEVTFTKPY